MSLRQALVPLLDAVFPPRCPVCGGAVAAQNGLCGQCWSALVIPGEPACDLCQRPFTAPEHAVLPEEALAQRGVCSDCAEEAPAHDGVAAATLYNPISRQLVLSFKHRGQIALAPLLARLMAARMSGIDGQWLLVPVPLHRWRLWRRGYNQSALLGRHVARTTGAQLVVDGLERQRRTPSLAGLGAAERARVMEGAIRVAPRHAGRMAGARVVLIDDVLTSGATTNACIAALRKAGAAQVRIACFARVMRGGDVPVADFDVLV
ncbi:MAG TPA: ComF family protein [Novosphingobium sp.]|nr:ComF family protein [Novosphingobium sp.]